MITESQVHETIDLDSSELVSINQLVDTAEQARVNILGVGVSALNMEIALRETESLLHRGEQGYVCVTGVHGIMEAQSDEQFRDILNRSFLTTPDGMPTVWLGRMHGFKHMSRVYGPDYMLGLCERSVARGYRHFLYGGKPGVAEELRAELDPKVPRTQDRRDLHSAFPPAEPPKKKTTFAPSWRHRRPIFCGAA